MTDTTDIVRALERINTTLEDIAGYISELAGYVPNPPAPQTEPEGIAPPENQVPAPTAEQSSAVAPEELATITDEERHARVLRFALPFQPQEEPAPAAPEAAAEEPAFEEMQAKLLEVARALGNSAVANILTGAGAWSAQDVPPWKRAEVMRACDEAIVADATGC